VFWSVSVASGRLGQNMLVSVPPRVSPPRVRRHRLRLHNLLDGVLFLAFVFVSDRDLHAEAAQSRSAHWTCHVKVLHVVFPADSVPFVGSLKLGVAIGAKVL
jgi:hypothetical protein